MKRILVIGCPGSGKSTFARSLSEKTGLPLVHLDMLFWNRDATSVPQEEFLAQLQTALAGDAWIIDGNYASSLEMRLKRAEQVFFLDLPVEDCLAGIRARRGKARDDLPWVEMQEDREFMDYVRRFPMEQRPRMMEMLAQYPGIECTVFKSHGEMENWLASGETIF